MKNTQELTLLFWHRKSKADVKGFAPIICRISIDGEDEELSVGVKVHLKNWNIEFKRAFGDPEAKQINSRISYVTAALESNFALLKKSQENITPLMLKNLYQGKPVELHKGEILQHRSRCRRFFR